MNYYENKMAIHASVAEGGIASAESKHTYNSHTDIEAVTSPNSHHLNSDISDSEESNNRYVTASEIADIIRTALSEMKIYVLESDITAAQNSVRAIIKETQF